MNNSVYSKYLNVAQEAKNDYAFNIIRTGTSALDSWRKISGIVARDSAFMHKNKDFANLRMLMEIIEKGNVKFKKLDNAIQQYKEKNKEGESLSALVSECMSFYNKVEELILMIK